MPRPSRWLDRMANVRIHGTTGEQPADRFEREERAALEPLARRPYHSLALPREVRSEPGPAAGPQVPRSTSSGGRWRVYAGLAGGGR